MFVRMVMIRCISTRLHREYPVRIDRGTILTSQRKFFPGTCCPLHPDFRFFKLIDRNDFHTGSFLFMEKYKDFWRLKVQNFLAHTVFILTNSLIPWIASSLPKPECLVPPKGNRGSDFTIPLMNTAPS